MSSLPPPIDWLGFTPRRAAGAPRPFRAGRRDRIADREGWIPSGGCHGCAAAPRRNPVAPSARRSWPSRPWSRSNAPRLPLTPAAPQSPGAPSPRRAPRRPSYLMSVSSRISFRRDPFQMPLEHPPLSYRGRHAPAILQTVDARGGDGEESPLGNGVTLARGWGGEARPGHAPHGFLGRFVGIFGRMGVSLITYRIRRR